MKAVAIKTAQSLLTVVEFLLDMASALFGLVLIVVICTYPFHDWPIHTVAQWVRTRSDDVLVISFFVGNVIIFHWIRQVFGKFK